MDVFCFFERERVSRERRKREKTERDRRRRGKNDLEFETRDALQIPGSPGLPLAGADVRNPLVIDDDVVVVRAAKRRKATIADIFL